MDFFVRRLEEAWDEAAARLASFVGAEARDLVFVPNATAGMNIVARSCPLEPDDEVLLTDHEYGAVRRVWGRRCTEARARTTLASLPTRWDSESDFVDQLFSRVTPRTKVIVISHVTSQTAVVFPVAAVCRQAGAQGILTVVDGPHALAMLPVNVATLECDFYTASCHKWLSAPLGSGFLHVRREWQPRMLPVTTSWGRSLSGRPARWQDEFLWPGTADPTPYLAVPAAIDVLTDAGIDRFRTHGQSIATYAEQRLRQCGAEPVSTEALRAPTMLTVHLPDVPRSASWPGSPHPLQVKLWTEHRIEVPVFEWRDRPHLRVSCHLYNTPADVDRLIDGLRHLIPSL